AAGGRRPLLPVIDRSVNAFGELHRCPAAPRPCRGRERRTRRAGRVHLQPGARVIAEAVGRASVSLEGKDIHQTLGGNKVLRGVDIQAPAGTTVAVIGPSGSGKSTLLRTLNRLNEPDSGDILLDGK